MSEKIVKERKNIVTKENLNKEWFSFETIKNTYKFSQSINKLKQIAKNNNLNIMCDFHPIAHNFGIFINKSDIDKLQELCILEQNNHISFNSIKSKYGITRYQFENGRDKLGYKGYRLSQFTDEQFKEIIDYCLIPTKKKKELTKIENYGSLKNASEVATKQRMKSCFKKYGVTYYTMTDECKNKMKNTMIEKYGVEHPLQVEEIHNKMKQTTYERFGVPIATMNSSVTDKRDTKYREELQEYMDSNNLCFFSETGINSSHSSKTIYYIINKLDIKPIIYKNKNYLIHKEDLDKINNEIAKLSFGTSSVEEKEIFDFCKEYIREEVLSNNRFLLKDLELDIYIPSKKVAIEFDGLYWHSELFKDKNYHINKTKQCEEHNVRLIHIYEDDWVFKKDVCKSIILSACGIYKEKIYARKCEIRELTKSEFDIFLNNNHLNGTAICKQKYGLYYNDTLVMCMGFGKPRYSKTNNDIELIRVCTKINTQVVGGFSKLLKHFITYNGYDNIISYINLDQFNGKGYMSNGFVLEHINKPSYFWVKHNCTFEPKHTREFAMKHNQQKIFDDFDISKTEVESMHEHGYYKVYNCGTAKVVYEV